MNFSSIFSIASQIFSDYFRFYRIAHEIQTWENLRKFLENCEKYFYQETCYSESDAGVCLPEVSHRFRNSYITTFALSLVQVEPPDAMPHFPGTILHNRLTVQFQDERALHLSLERPRSLCDLWSRRERHKESGPREKERGGGGIVYVPRICVDGGLRMDLPWSSVQWTKCLQNGSTSSLILSSQRRQFV